MNNSQISQELIKIIDSDQILWDEEYGDLTHRLNYDELNENSIVFDVGGYLGEWCANIYSRYTCNVYVFEPIPKHYEFIKNRFSPNHKIRAYNFGFDGKRDRQDTLYVFRNASSLYKSVDEYEKTKVMIKNFGTFLNTFEGDVDLLKLNIEGSEYDLLESLNSDQLKRIKNIQVQFHGFIKGCVKRREDLRTKLSLTHNCNWNFEFIWENWKIR